MTQIDIDLGLEKDTGIDYAINIDKGLEIDIGIGNIHGKKKTKKPGQLEHQTGGVSGISSVMGQAHRSSCDWLGELVATSRGN